MAATHDESIDGSAAVEAQVLVVDDEPELRLLLSRSLAGDGYGVSVAADGGDALARLKAAPAVDAVVTDINMPAATGIELASEILENYPGVPVLFVSSDTPPERLLRHPLVDGLRKPVRLAEVRSRVRTLLVAAGRLKSPRRWTGTGTRARSVDRGD